LSAVESLFGEDTVLTDDFQIKQGNPKGQAAAISRFRAAARVIQDKGDIKSTLGSFPSRMQRAIEAHCGPTRD
jgi:hypothetical protein